MLYATVKLNSFNIGKLELRRTANAKRPALVLEASDKVTIVTLASAPFVGVTPELLKLANLAIETSPSVEDGLQVVADFLTAYATATDAARGVAMWAARKDGLNESETLLAEVAEDLAELSDDGNAETILDRIS